MTECQKTAPIHELLRCDLCNSYDIINTIEGYTCTQCGVVLEIQRFEHYHPFIESKIQNAKRGETTIGTQKERLSSHNSQKFTNLNRFHAYKTNKEIIFQVAKREISRYLHILKLPLTLNEQILPIFKQIYTKIKPNTRLRNPDNLIPVIVYYYCKNNNFSINENTLIENSHIDKKKYNSYKLQVVNHFPNYHKRDQKQYVLSSILGLVETYQFSMNFYFEAKLLLDKLWAYIKTTTDKIIAGVISSICILCSQSPQISISTICKYFNVSMSTVQFQVKKNLIERFHIEGFRSLVRSKDVLEDFINRICLRPINVLIKKENVPFNKKIDPIHKKLLFIIQDVFEQIFIRKLIYLLFSLMLFSQILQLKGFIKYSPTLLIEILVIAGKGPP